MKSAKQSEQTKIQRMLKWFEAQLPEHEVGEWLLEIRPHRQTVLDERGATKWGSSRDTIGLLTGSGSCLQCRERFEFAEECGNYCVYPESKQEQFAQDFPTLTTAYKIEEMKGLIQQKAEKSGKCWGTVPRINVDGVGPVAVADCSDSENAM